MIRTTRVSISAIRPCVVLIALAVMAAGLPARADFTFADFSDVSELSINGDAAQVGSLLRLTPATTGQGGSAFTTDPISLGDENTFSTHFQFQITGHGGFDDTDGLGADGLVFVVQTVSNSVGSNGGGIGYLGISPSLGIEFDTWFNGEHSDPNGNHVGINLNGNMASVVTTSEATRFNNDAVWNAWIEYSGATDLLEVRWSTTNVRPALAQLSSTVDLPPLLGQETAFVGFTSGTGAVYGNHDVLNWSFRESGLPFPEPSTMLLLGVALAALANTRRRA